MIKRLAQILALIALVLSATATFPQGTHAGVCIYGESSTCFTGKNQGQCLTRCNQIHGCQGIEFRPQFDTCEQYRSKESQIIKDLVNPQNSQDEDLPSLDDAKVQEVIDFVEEVAGEKKEKKSTDNFSIPSAQPLNPFGGAKIPDILGRLLKIATGIIGSITLVVIIYGGVVFMAQGANADKRRKSLEILVWAGLGVCAIFASYALITFIVRAFGI